MAGDSSLSLTPGIKLARYTFDFTQFADNGKTSETSTAQPFVEHSAAFTGWQPSFDVNYNLRHNWSMYSQYSTGSVIPPSNVFDVKNAAVSRPAEADKNQNIPGRIGVEVRQVTLDLDTYYIHFENDYSSSPDPVTLEPIYYLTGTSRTKGAEVESNIYMGGGLSTYLNGTLGSAKYTESKLWVSQAPSNTETIGVSYQHRNWDLGFFNKRIGPMYNDNGATNQAVKIDPFDITNLYLNYTVKNSHSEFEETKIRLTVNNVFDRHSLVAVIPAATKTSDPAPGDILTLLAARSVSLSVTFGFSPSRAKSHP